MRINLRLKILLLTVSLIILINIAIGFIIIQRVSFIVEGQIKYRLLSLASNMALNAEDPLVLEDELYLAKLVKDAMKNQGFLYAKVLNEDYKIIASHNIEEWGNKDSTLIYEKGKDFVSLSNKIEIIKPVILGDKKTIGYIKLAMSNREIKEAQFEIIKIISLITIVFILLGIIISMIFSNILTKQLRLLMNGVKRVSEGDLNVKIKKVTSDELGVFTDTFNSMVVNIREKELIKRAFTRYVSKQVAEKVFEDPDAFLNKLKGERILVSIMFADIMGFTTMSERMSPEEVVSILNEYLSKMTDSVFKFEGTLDKFIGDCVMAVFGAPIGLENPSLNAVLCAMDIQKSVNALNLKRRSRGLGNINIGIGINTGEAVVGNIGSNERLDYTVIGDNVNLASRLQSVANAKNIPIIVSRSVIENIEGKIEYMELEQVKVKGKEKLIEIFSIKIE